MMTAYAAREHLYYMSLQMVGLAYGYVIDIYHTPEAEQMGT